MAQTQPQQKPPLTYAEQLNVAGNMARIHSAMATMPLRTDQGTHANNKAHWTLLMMLVHASYIPVVKYYIPVWIGLLVYRQIKANRSENSTFEGFQYPLSRYVHDRTARVLEVVILAAVGLGVRVISPDLGTMIASTALSSAVALVVRIENIKAIKRQDRDARAQMAYRARIAKGGDW